MAEGCVSDAQETNSYLTLASDLYFEHAFLDYINDIFSCFDGLKCPSIKNSES